MGKFAYSPDSKLIVNTYLHRERDQGYQLYLDIWDLDTNKRVGRKLLSTSSGYRDIDLRSATQFPLAFSPDGGLLAVASDQDGSLRILKTDSLVERDWAGN